MSDPSPERDNPFSSPMAESPAPERAKSAMIGPLDEDDDIWQYESLLLVRRGTHLPDRCIACNNEAEPKRLRFVLRQEISRWLVVVLVLTLGPLFLLIVAMCLPTAQLSPGLCHLHSRQETRGRRATICLLLLGMCLPIMPLVSYAIWPTLEIPGSFSFPVLGLILIFATIVYAAVRTRPLRAKKIDEEFIWLKDVPTEYVAAFSQSAAEA